MEKLTNIVEAIIFASGNAIETDDIREKLGITKRELDECVRQLEKKYTGDCGIHLLNFNHKLQFATNPEYKEAVSAVITPIREREFSRTILECAAIIAYKQPITRAELEEIRGVSSDYAISTLLSLEMIYPSGKRTSAGSPYEYSTTDNFLKRFKLKSLKDLPDYDELLKKITELNEQYQSTSSYLYEKDVYVSEEEETAMAEDKPDSTAEAEENTGFDVPEFLKDIQDDIVKIQ